MAAVLGLASSVDDMDISGVMQEQLDRVPDLVESVVADLDVDALGYRPDAEANPIGWLVWHLTRVQDDHLAGAASALGWDQLTDQIWTTDGFAERFDLPFDDGAIGYGQSSDEVGQVRVPADLLVDYHRAVHERTTRFLATVEDEEWDAVVDDRWDPPVTLTARLASVLGDVLQHVGQAAYVRGLLERR